MICEDCTNCRGVGIVTDYWDRDEPTVTCLNCGGSGQMCLLDADEKRERTATEVGDG